MCQDGTGQSSLHVQVLLVMQDTELQGNERFYGFLVDLLPIVFQAARLNGTFEYILAPVNSGGSETNGSWSGAIQHPQHVQIEPTGTTAAA
jgi:hypothetical protein